MELDEILSIFDAKYQESVSFYKDYVTEDLVKEGERLCVDVKGFPIELKKEIAKWVYSKVDDSKPVMAMFLRSVALFIYQNPKYMEEAYDLLLNNTDHFTKNNLYFYDYQLFYNIFNYKELDTPQIKIKQWKLFNEIVRMFKDDLTVDISPIPYEKRNKNFVLVITEQMIAITHGPTKTALDRCKVIMTEQKKDVLLISTNEVLTQTGKMPIVFSISANSSDFTTEEAIPWKGVNVPFYNVEGEMPYTNTLDEILAFIRKLAPSRIVGIGTAGILLNLANLIIPSVAIGLCPSDLGRTSVAYQTLGKKVEDRELEVLSSVGLDRGHVIESVFTSSLREQEKHITREEVGITEDAFVITVIGGRLREEVTDEFLQMLEDVFEDDYYLLFLGVFDEVDARTEKFDKLSKAHKLMYVTDILATLEVCDLYVNPTRRGGGTSCVEAMFKGIPVVSIDFGDVSTNVGPEFLVKDYDEMKEKIKRYHDDIEFYREKSGIAKKRAAVLLDTEKEFIRILDEVDRREGII